MYDMVVMGNSVVDAIVPVADDILPQFKLTKGDFHFVDFDTFIALSEVCDIEKFVAGGSAANTAYTLAKLGKKVAFVSRFGGDGAGRHFLEEMTQAGVAMPTPDTTARTMEIFVLVTPDGQRTFVCPGVTAPLSVNDVDAHAIRQSKWLLVEGYLLLDQKPAVDHAIQVARQHNINIAITLAAGFVLDNAFKQIAAELDKGLNLLLCNKEEMAHLLAHAEKEDTDTANRLKKSIAATPRMVTDGANGATFYNGTNPPITTAAVPVNKVIDTTGAGDIFAAGFLKHYLETGDVAQGAALGHRLAHQVVQQTGARLATFNI